MICKHCQVDKSEDEYYKSSGKTCKKCHYLVYVKPYDQKNYVKRLQISNRRYYKMKKEVSDSFIKFLFNQTLKAHEVTPELIDIKRKQYELKKAIK